MYRILYPQQRILCPSGPIVPRFRNPIPRPLPYSARLQRHALFRTTFFSGPLEFNQFECLANCTALGRVEWKNILKCASAFLVNTNSFLKKKKSKLTYWVRLIPPKSTDTHKRSQEEATIILQMEKYKTPLMLSEVTVKGPVWKTYIPRPREEGGEEANWKAEWDVERFSRTEKVESWFSSADS